MSKRRALKPALALLLTGLALALPAGAMARFANSAPDLRALTRAVAPVQITLVRGAQPFDWGDAGIGAAVGVLASVLLLSSVRARDRRRSRRGSREAIG